MYLCRARTERVTMDWMPETGNLIKIFTVGTVVDNSWQTHPGKSWRRHWSDTRWARSSTRRRRSWRWAAGGPSPRGWAPSVRGSSATSWTGSAAADIELRYGQTFCKSKLLNCLKFCTLHITLDFEPHLIIQIGKEKFTSNLLPIYSTWIVSTVLSNVLYWIDSLLSTVKWTNFWRFEEDNNG